MPEEKAKNTNSKFSSFMNLQFVWFLGHLTTGKFLPLLKIIIDFKGI